MPSKPIKGVSTEPVFSPVYRVTLAPVAGLAEISGVPGRQGQNENWSNLRHNCKHYKRNWRKYSPK